MYVHIHLSFTVQKVIFDWIYVNHSKLHIGSYDIINFKDFKAL